MKNNQDLPPSEAARVLGSIKTPKKTASSAANVRKANEGRQAKRKKLADIPCTCDGGDSTELNDHIGLCPRYHAIRYRIKNNLPLE